jgi:hypothetical protein
MTMRNIEQALQKVILHVCPISWIECFGLLGDKTLSMSDGGLVLLIIFAFQYSKMNQQSFTGNPPQGCGRVGAPVEFGGNLEMNFQNVKI